MPIDLPETALEIEERAKTDVQRDLPGSNPFLKNSVMGALITGYSNRVFDSYVQLNNLQVLLIPDTATDDFLERWAAIYGKQRLAATQSIGNVIASGTPASNIPLSTTFTSTDGLLYDSTSSVNILNNVLSVTSINRSGTVATVVVSVAHNLAVSVPIIITGASPTGYNVSGAEVLNIIDEFTFTYTVSNVLSTPATGTIVLTHDSVPVPVESQDFQDSENDINVNLDTGATLSLQSPLVGIDNEVGIGSSPISGGSDQETDESLRVRLLDRIQNPVAHFNVSDITEKAKEIAGVTRVFVQEVTPAVGQVTIFFMRDNDTTTIPDAGEVVTVKNKILEIKPANTATVDVIVSAPTATTVPFTFTGLTPNTPSMQTAITANLQQFFAEETDVAVNIQEDAYRAAIQNTIDTETGDRVIDFTLSTPSGDIVIPSSNIGVLGTVTYP